MSIYVQFVYGGEGLVSFDKEKPEPIVKKGKVFPAFAPRRKIQISGRSQILAQRAYVDTESLLVVDFEGGRLYFPTAKKFVTFSAVPDEDCQTFFPQ